MRHKTKRRRVIQDLRRQLRWIEGAIADGNSEWLEQYALQLSGTAMLLVDEDYLADTDPLAEIKDARVAS